MSKSRRNRAIRNGLHKRLAKEFYVNHFMKGVMTYKTALSIIGYLPSNFTPSIAGNAYKEIIYKMTRKQKPRRKLIGLNGNGKGELR